MSRGFIIHAYNNLEIDYGTMALCSAMLVKKHLKENSVSLITSNDTLSWITSQHGLELINYAFNNIIVINKENNISNRKFFDTRYSSKIQPYYNNNRSDSYELSPYDETILLDADYLVLDNSLDCVWGSVEDIMVNKSLRDLNHNIDLNGFDTRFNDMGIPLYWATLMYFKKTEKVKCIFELMKFIKDNYSYYKNLYHFSSNGYFRNDYALSIAIHMMNNQSENDSVVPLPTPYINLATEYDDLIEFKDGKALFVSEEEQGKFLLHKVITNVHVMNKWCIPRMADRIINYAKN